jgi:hypothetical protein
VNEYYKEVPSEVMFDFETPYARFAVELPDGCRFAECGVANGRSLLYLCACLQQLGKKYQCYAIDSMAYGGESQRNEIINHIIKSGLPDIQLMEMSSLDASTKFPDGFFDFVFIDSSHSYLPTRAELMLWPHKLKDGGILAGHDYDKVNSPGVYTAVNELVPAASLKIEETRLGYGVWWFRKGVVEPAPAVDVEVKSDV